MSTQELSFNFIAIWKVLKIMQSGLSSNVGVKALEERLNDKLVVKNRVGLLSVLSRSILREVEALQQGESVSLEGEIDLAAEVQHFEADLIRSALIKTNGNQRQAARRLNVKVSTLNMKMKRHGIIVNSYFSNF